MLLCVMPRTAAAKLKRLMTHAGLTYRALAERAGYKGPSSIQTHMKDDAEVISVDVAIRLARALEGLGSPPLTYADIVATLSGVAVKNGHAGAKPRAATLDTPVGSTVKSRPLRIIAAVQAGSWRQAAEWGAGLEYTVTVPVPPQWAAYDLVGIEVHGPSMDRVYPPGTVLVCVSYLDLAREPRHGERVIVQRFRGGDVEATCKEYRRDADGVVRLWPLSAHPDFQAPVRLDEDVDTRITHRVVAAIVSEPS